jgi:hypothetical protein
MKPAIERIDIAAEELNQLLERAREALPEEDYLKLKAALETLEYLTEFGCGQGHHHPPSAATAVARQREDQSGAGEDRHRTGGEHSKGTTGGE